MRDYSEMMHGYIREVIERFGPRPACSSAERQAGQYTMERLQPLCSETHAEDFECHPHAFIGFISFLPVLYFFALLLYHRLPEVSFALVLFLGFLFTFEFVRYRRVTDFLWPKRTGQNVIGVIKPSGPVRRRLILGGHLDSAYEFNIWRLLRSGGIAHSVVSVVLCLILLVACTANMVCSWLGAEAPGFLYAIPYYGFPVFALNLFFHTYRPVPGAGDNLSACAVLLGLAQQLADERSNDCHIPESTELVLLSTSSEEAGLRGAMAYCEMHAAEMEETPTQFIAVETLHKVDKLSIVTKEICPGAKHDPTMIALLEQIAKENGWPIKRVAIPIGATDAAEFTRRGVSATAILGLDTEWLPKEYHTRHDVPDSVDPRALQRALELCFEYVRRYDAAKLDVNDHAAPG